MRIKPTPLVETSLVFSISWLLALIASVFWTNDFNAALSMASNIAFLYLLISYTFWAVAGLLVKKKSHLVRFFVNLTVTSVIAIAATTLLLNAFGAATGKAATLVAKATANVVGLGVIYFLSAVIAALLTFFIITRPKKSK